MQAGNAYWTSCREFPTLPSMDPVRELLVGRLGEIGETLKSASEKLGRNHAYLQQFVQRGRVVAVAEETRDG